MSPRGEAFEYTRSRIAPPIFLGCTAERGRYPHPLREPGAKPSSTSAVVLRPLSHGVQNRICSSGILWMYFGFKYGILFDGRIITRKTQKSHRNTENLKNRLDETHVVPSPVPHTETTEINGIHEKGDRGGGKNIFSIFWGAGGRLRRGARRGGNILFADATPTGGEAFEYTCGRFAPPIFFGCTAEKGRSLLVHPPSFIALLPLPLYASQGTKPHPLREPGGEAFEYTRGRFAPPPHTPYASPAGRSFRVRPQSYCAQARVEDPSRRASRQTCKQARVEDPSRRASRQTCEPPSRRTGSNLF